MRRDSLFDPTCRQEILGRLNTLTPTSSRLWGTMSVGEALAHLSDQLRFATRELTPRGAKGPLTWRIFQWFGIAVMPWPRGGLDTSPELLQTPAGDFLDGRDELARLIEKFADTPVDQLGAHPMFGALAPRGWGILAWRHLDHHLRQFGA